MKKLLVAYVAIAIAVLVGINVVHGVEKESPDEYLMNRYILDNYGAEYEGVLWDDVSDEEFIKFEVTLNGEGKYISSINREYYQHLYD